MKRTVMAVATTLGAVCMLAASSAHAQEYRDEFGRRGQFIISADRLFPLFAVSHDSVGTDDGNGNKLTTSKTQTSMSFFYGYTPPNTDVFYTVPRAGFDYTIVNNVTLGGELVLYFTLGAHATVSTQTNNSSTTNTNDLPSTTVFGVAPRGGYIFHFSNLFSLWARGGFSFYLENQKQSATNNGGTETDTTNTHVFTLDLDPQFVVTPLPNIGLTAGLSFDIPLGGGVSTEQDIRTANNEITTKQSGNATSFFFGVTLGLFVHF